MTKLCDICSKSPATRFENSVEGGSVREYAYCEACYVSALRSGVRPQQVAAAKIARRGLECDSCGCNAETFKATYTFGCPDCYRNMRDIAMREAARLAATPFAPYADIPFSKDDALAVKQHVVSSRIRLARNVEGLAFPQFLHLGDDRVEALMQSALAAAQGIFDAKLYKMVALEPAVKMALVEEHRISMALARSSLGAVITERGNDYGITVMVNEEDHLRLQSMREGLALKEAYARLKPYDDNLSRYLRIAYDPVLGYLTACPTNLGTGMRASAMMFLPALNRTGRMGEALGMCGAGITARGYFGEGSGAAYDMYQISNSRTLNVSEAEIIAQVERAAVRICRLESDALANLLRYKKSETVDGIFRSYSTLKGAYMIGSEELMSLLADVKLGVILDILPIKKMDALNRLVWLSTASLDILTDGKSDEERRARRAELVRKSLTEAE